MRGWLFIALILAAGCGGEGYGGHDDPPDGVWLARVSLGTTGNDGQIYAFMVRVSQVQVKLDNGHELSAGPVSVDALRGAVILEQRNDALPHELDVRFDQPPSGSGVLPGERVAVYVGGLVDGQPFEYRSDEMEHVQLPVTSEHIDLRFNASTWTTGWSAADFDDAAPHQLNDEHNVELAQVPRASNPDLPLGVRVMRLIPVLALGLLLQPAAAMADAAPHVFALIVANNGSYDGSRPPLRFADDDGVRYRELFGMMSRDVELYTVMDAETQQTFADLVTTAHVPRRADVLEGLKSTFAKIREARAAGERTVFYFVYSGHGDVRDGMGFVHLLDGPLTRQDLYAQVIESSPADVNHVVVDACNAYFMVASRGGQAKAAGDYGNLVRTLVSRENLDAHPNTGVILATTSAAEVHEWSRVEAGVFSHELRTAMSGAADANGDGAVSYDEVAAFLAAANGGVPDPKARVQALTRPPRQNLAEPFVRISAQGSLAVFPNDWQGRFYIEDDRRVRYADINKPAGQDLTLHLVPRPTYYVRAEDREYRLRGAGDGTRHELADAPPEPISIAVRGAATDQLDNHLFAIPYDNEYARGFAQARALADDPLTVTVAAPPAPPDPLTPWKIGALTVAGSTAVAAVVFDVLARHNSELYRDSAGSAADVSALRERAHAQHTAAVAFAGVAGGALLTAGGLYLYDWLARDD